MISVVIPTLNDAAALPRALAPLVEGVASGVIKQVVVADGGSSDATLDIADAAGCDLVSSDASLAARVRAGVAAAKAKWLLLLPPQTILGGAWLAEADRFIANEKMRTRAGVFRLAFDDPSAEAKRALFWARLRMQTMKLPYPEQGLLLSRFFYDGLGGYPESGDAPELEFARRIGAKRWVMFDSEARTGAERFLNHSGLRSVAAMARYWTGADPVELAKAYD